MIGYTQFTILDLTDSVYVEGTQTAATSRWKGVADLDRLRNGQQITYWLPFGYSAGDYYPYTPTGGTSANGESLELTLSDGSTTGPIPCFYKGVTRITSHYAQGDVIHLTYRENARIGSQTVTQGWWADANYDSNTIDNQIVYFYGTTGDVGVFANSIFMRDGDGTYQDVVTTRTTATTKEANTNGFEIGSPVWYINTTYAVNTAITGWGVVYSQYGNLIDGRYSFNVTSSGTDVPVFTAKEPLYLVGTIQNGLFYLDTDWWTHEPDNPLKVYVFLGYTYDRYRFSLNEINSWMVYDEASGRLIDYTNNLSALAQGAAQMAQSSANYAQDAADRAQQSANNAQSSADQANEGVTNLRSEVASNYVTISDFSVSNESIQSSVTEVRTIAEAAQLSADSNYSDLSGNLEDLEGRVSTNETSISSIATTTSNLEQRADSINLTVEEHTREIEELQGYTTGLKATMNLTASGLDISGGDTTANTKVHINGNGVSIMDGDNVPAYFHGQDSKMINVEVTELLRIGNHKLLARSGGTNTTVVYVGDE